MSLFKRIANLMKKPEPALVERKILDVVPGDIIEVSFVTYQVTGRTKNTSRNAVLLTLQDGNTIQYLHIEDREKTEYELYTPIDGRLDSIDEIPTSIELEGTMYHMEEQYTGRTVIVGKAPFHTAGEQYVWQFQSDDRKLLRIEWQDGRMMMYEGEWIIPADVHILRST